MAESELLRLQRIAVDGLFGTYGHDIQLKLEDRVTLLHGPHGVGKTVVLGMVDALLRRRLGYIRGIPFSRFSLEFRDGSIVCGRRVRRRLRDRLSASASFPQRLISATEELAIAPPCGVAEAALFPTC